MGHERNIIDGEFSDMEVIDTKKSMKHDYKDKSRKREKLKEKKFFLMLDEEIRFYEDMVSRTRHSKQVVEDILEFYRDLDHIINNELNPDNQSIIRFGKGSGFNSTTYNLSLDENNRARIASRTISEDFFPMGWAVIEFQEK